MMIIKNLQKFVDLDYFTLVRFNIISTKETFNEV